MHVTNIDMWVVYKFLRIECALLGSRDSIALARACQVGGGVSLLNQAAIIASSMSLELLLSALIASREL